MQRQFIRLFTPALILFFILSAAFFILTERLKNYGFDSNLLLAGNLIIFLITFLSFLLSVRGLTAKSNYAFFRMVYGSFILKLFTLAGVAFAYIMIMKKEVNKPGLIFCMLLYLVYTYFEVSALIKISKKKVNG